MAPVGGIRALRAHALVRALFSGAVRPIMWKLGAHNWTMNGCLCRYQAAAAYFIPVCLHFLFNCPILNFSSHVSQKL